MKIQNLRKAAQHFNSLSNLYYRLPCHRHR